MNRILYFFFIFSLTSTINSFAQSGSISGQVKDKTTQKPIFGVIVTISENGKMLNSFNTDVDGVYKFSSLPQGVYSLTAVFLGYMTTTIDSINIVEGGTINRDIAMNQQPVMLEGVVVVDYKVPLIDKDKTVSGGTVTAEAISMSPAGFGKKSNASKKKTSIPEIPDLITNEKSGANRDVEQVRSGLLTASELNDFSKWELWKDIQEEELKYFRQVWGISPQMRYTVQVVSENYRPVIDATVTLENSTGETLWKARTDNTGKAELWAGIFNKPVKEKLKIIVQYKGSEFVQKRPTIFNNGINVFKIPSGCAIPDTVDIAFIVDATGSMADEIKYLQQELLDIMTDAQGVNSEISINMGSVFYRDFGDLYLTRKFDFCSTVAPVLAFINDQEAIGGGDFEEAVDEALKEAVINLKWSKNARSRLLFMILDAPPHKNPEVIKNLHYSIEIAAEKGIRIIPIIASGASGENGSNLEYLMRSIALATNGTYVFLTDHSKIGNTHAKPVTDEYDVELLNNLIKRLIFQYCYSVKCTGQTDNQGVDDTTFIFRSPVIAHEIIDSTRRKQSIVPKQNLKDFTQVAEDITLDDSTFNPNTDQTNSEHSGQGLLAENPVIKFYPNPTSGKLTVEINYDIEELYLSDISGKLISKIEVKKKRMIELDLGNYCSGIYFLRFRVENSWVTGKVILSH